MGKLVKMSSKGQIVVPKDLRDELELGTGSSFVIFGKEDTLVLKKVNVPSAKEAFERINAWGTKLAKEKGWKEKDVMKMIHKGSKLTESDIEELDHKIKSGLLKRYS